MAGLLDLLVFAIGDNQLEPQLLYFFLNILFVTCHLLAFVFEGVDLFFLNEMQIFLHLQLALQLCQIIIVSFIGNYDIFVWLELWQWFLLQFHQHVVL